MAFYIEDYENPHISVCGTLSMLGTTSEFEVNYETERLEDEERAEKLDRISAERRAYECILDKFKSSPNIEDSLTICWQPLWAVERMRKYDVSQDEIDAVLENQQSYMTRLPGILEQTKAKMEIERDGYILDKNAAILVHLSLGIVLLSRLVERQHTERQWEWIDDALRVINMPKTESITLFYEQTKFPRTIPLSYKMAKALIWSMSAGRLFVDYKYEEALRCYSEVVTLFSEANEGIFDWLEYGDSLSDEARHYELIPDNDGIGTNLLEDEHGELEPVSKFSHDLFRLENAVKAFDALIDEDSRDTKDTNWTQVAEHCRFFAKNWHLLPIPVESKHIPEQETVGESWAIAHGIVLNRMSNDDRIKELRLNRDYQIEDRLRLYFFGDTWDKLPDKARTALISADREYENARGRRPIIFDHLRHAARAIMVESLWKPYREFLRGKAADGLKDLSDLQQVRQIVEDEQSEPDLAPLVKSPYFDEFLGTISEDAKFVRRLPEKLLDLNDWANMVSHEHHWGYKGFEGQIRETYAEFLGIGRNGILPRLMRLHPKVNKNSRKQA